MNSSFLNGGWIWHPEWSEESPDSAGSFVHFRRQITLETLHVAPISLQISADTKYKLYVNAELVCVGPVKGDENLWFYDQVDIQPYLRLGVNHIAVRVLRLFYATQFATSFPRLSSPGLYVRFVGVAEAFDCTNDDNSDWKTALDTSTRLPINLEEDDFLHTYEQVDNSQQAELNWVTVKHLKFAASHGLIPRWKLSPRLIPPPLLKHAYFKAIHNVRSGIPRHLWERVLLHPQNPSSSSPICLPAGTSHHLELEASHHLTAFLKYKFQRPGASGSVLNVTYSECYEDAPFLIPYLRNKGDRCDTTKLLIGPQDSYVFGGCLSGTHAAGLKYEEDEVEKETFAPFHFRTLRFLSLDIRVADGSDLVLDTIEMISTTYPLDVLAAVKVKGKTICDDSSYSRIWDTSIRTLTNCMHDCYEDCPFYEQLQYAMDTRSSILFTYSVSGDDRLGRQAMIQLHNSYQPNLGLTASRAPSHQLQIIPHFSLFWVVMVADHFEYFHDTSFVRQFTPACDGVLEHFGRRVDPTTGLVRPLESSNHWEFVDWTEAWRPMGIPTAVSRTGFCTYTSMLYAYTLKRTIALLIGIGRPALAGEYQARADSIVQAIQKHCFDGKFFTDGIASAADPRRDYSQHSQIWAVLCGATTGQEATQILEQALTSSGEYVAFSPVSLAMSFYTLRALSLVRGNLYDEQFHSFWKPWKTQLDFNLSTWEEDTVSQRSDCHAWACVALYEFTAEVAGIRPGKPGWASITFQPRVNLFPEVNIKVPFGGCQESRSKSGFAAGIAHVKWRTTETTDIECALVIEVYEDEASKTISPPVLMVLPGGIVEEVVDSSKKIVRVIKADLINRC